jgi:hypothetical protein
MPTVKSRAVPFASHSCHRNGSISAGVISAIARSMPVAVAGRYDRRSRGLNMTCCARSTSRKGHSRQPGSWRRDTEPSPAPRGRNRLRRTP